LDSRAAEGRPAGGLYCNIGKRWSGGFLEFELNGYRVAVGLQETFMPNHKLKRGSDWRCRREEYLRASGRYDDLIREGYETSGPQAKLVVIPGGRRRPAASDPEIRLFFVKRGLS
jgi:hypothetical protein